MPRYVGDEYERRVRTEAMAWLQVRTNDGADPITKSDLADFTVDGQKFRLMDEQRGIWKPSPWRTALSMTTTYRPEGAIRPYNDAVGDDGLMRYKWQGTDGQRYDNVALRESMRTHQPLIWFVGVGVGVVQAIFPIFLIGEEPENHQFVVALDSSTRDALLPNSPDGEIVRRYRISTVRARLHQRVFRSTVMRAYDTRCAVCSLRHDVLLDAAHIVPDGQPGGDPTVRNGIALCKIHHAAFDTRILGIRPDHTVQIRRDLLDEIDGPMLRHGLQELHGGALMALPTARAERPDQDKLDWAYQQFLTAELPRHDRVHPGRAEGITLEP